MQRVWSTYLDEILTHKRGRSSPAPQKPSTLTIPRNVPKGQPPPSPLNVGYANVGSESNSNLSLTINYIPSKITAPTGAKRRKFKDGMPLGVPRGGGMDAFRSGADRIGAGRYEDDEDDPFQKGKKKLSWTKFKWILFFFNCCLTFYSVTSLIFCLLTWFNVWSHADIVRVGNVPELVISTIAASCGILTSLIGWAGILLNNRAFLAVYCLLTWVTFAFLVVPGYITYRKRAFNLEGKLNAQWSRQLGTEGRLRVQNQLGCCGYFSPFVEATISATCYARSVLPGCKKDYLFWQRKVLGRWFIVAFAIVPVHLGVMIAALLCSNHVTYRFGKGMMPKRYRLSAGTMAVIMDQYASQLAEYYGPDVAADIVKRSRSDLNLALANAAGERSPISGPYSAGSQLHSGPSSATGLTTGYNTGYAN